MNVTAPTVRPDYSPADRVTSNRRQQAKLSWKRRQMQDLAGAIYTEVEKSGLRLPLNRQDYDRHVWSDLEHEAGYDICDSFKRDWNERHDELVKLYYSVKRTNKAVYAVFQQGGVNKPMLLSAWYNKHRFDMVWLWRKSQLIRNIYRQYLEVNEDLRKSTHPIHMVLTVPHKDGLFNGKKFYAREILEFFKEMRRCPFWKKHVHGGEYGLEIKRSKVNGLHIHVHSLVFLNKTCSVNEFRAWLRDKWTALTGGSMIHAETLYYYARKENGQYITEQVRKRNKHGEWEDVHTMEIVPASDGYDPETGEWGDPVEETFKPVPVERRKKHYINDNSTTEEYLQGVLECIKYHFKHDAAEDENGSWDLQLMADILNNSRRLRFYSRFGKFYKEKALCFDRLDEEDPEGIEGEEIELNGDVSRAERDLVNPFTFEPAQPGEYGLFISSPEWLKYSSKNDLQPFTLLTYGNNNFIPIRAGFTLKEIIGNMCRGEIWKVLENGWKAKEA